MGFPQSLAALICQFGFRPQILGTQIRVITLRTWTSKILLWPFNCLPYTSFFLSTWISFCPWKNMLSCCLKRTYKDELRMRFGACCPSCILSLIYQPKCPLPWDVHNKASSKRYHLPSKSLSTLFQSESNLYLKKCCYKRIRLQKKLY